MLPAVTAGNVISTVAGKQASDGLVIKIEGGMQPASPIWKSLNELSPSACVVVAVLAPVVVVDHKGELNLLTMKLDIGHKYF